MSSAFALSDKSVLVTGATGDLGLACCSALSAQGASIFASGRRESLDTLGHPSWRSDLCEAEGIASLVDAVPELDGVVFAHGVSTLRPVQFLNKDSIGEVMEPNLTASLSTLSLLLKKKRIRAGGAIVFIASIAGLTGTAGNAAYAASKGGIIAATRSLAVELARKKIRVNAICPGWIETGLTDSLNQNLSDESVKAQQAKYPLGAGHPQDVANAASFLLSDASRWITGTALPVDGGYTCQ
ncbi:SDR family oxidoreductase [Rubellicoccus peritrichatus]|uniref:SDR family oxidoreductase n=1 Tax=Rubellicoccus peritrichatus TaxID=3080537 RepID=A0AAQ3LFM4_9BACT|nr:SDR family oxidoreductase [Puniceicoccus sp. CR14]WOO42940.1 SDR family oxidoreductase [Puniceicoccus sp. CR14]